MVYLFDTRSAHPVYHIYGTIAERKGRPVDVTFCGLLMYDGQTRYMAQLPRHRADLFARACQKCFEPV